MKYYSLISCPQGDWHEVVVNERNARCIGKTIYKGHSRGEAYRAIVEDAGIDLDTREFDAEACDDGTV